MKTKNRFWYLTVAMVWPFLFSSPVLAQPTQGMEKSKDAADVIFINGKVYTVNTRDPFAEAVAIKDGKFLAVGSAREIEKLAGKQTRVVDLGGAFAMPGFIDAHIHPARP